MTPQGDPAGAVTTSITGPHHLRHMAETLRGEILTHLCRHREYLLAIVGLLGVFLALSLVGTRVIEAGTSAHVVNAMNVVGLSAFFLVFAGLMLYCYSSEIAYR